MFLMFRLLRGASKGVAAGRGVTVKKQSPCDPVCVGLMLGISILSLAYMLVNGLNNGLLTADIIALSVIGFIGLLVGDDRRRTRQLADTPEPPRTFTATELRARADQLTPDTTIVDVPADWRPVRCPDVRFEQPSQVTLTEQPDLGPVATLARLEGEYELDERMRRVAAIMITECPVCDAGEAEICGLLENEPWYLLDSEIGIIAHGRRIGKAVKEGNAQITDVVAQFDGHTPDEVWASAL